MKRAGVDGGVLYCGKRVRTVPDDMKLGGLALQQNKMEFVRTRCEPASMSRVRARQEGAQCTPGEIREMRSITGSLRWVQEEHVQTSHSQPVSYRRNNQHPFLSDHERAVQTVKRFRGQSELGLRFGPLPTKALDNADADPNEEGSDDE